MKKCAIFSCMGLGDGLIALVLSNNLRLNGYAVETFHPFLQELQEWFPDLPLKPFPEVESLKDYDHFFIIYEKSSWMQTILSHCQTHYPKQTIVLNPIATLRKDYPFWEHGQFEGNRSFVENLFHFCRQGLQLKVTTKSNGISALSHSIAKKCPKRVIIHPMSSRQGKNWPKDKYLQLNEKLQTEGFDPVFILSHQEREGWDLNAINAPECSTLSDLAYLVCESGFMIGNDSGIGHLASCLGIPTLTICRSHQVAKFWRPAWAPGVVVTPSSLIPNLKGLRWRDKKWQHWISVNKVFKLFYSLIEENTH